MEIFRALMSTERAFGVTFLFEATLFVAAAPVAMRIMAPAPPVRAQLVAGE